MTKRTPANTVKKAVKAEQSTKGIEAILEERRQTHGKFSEHAQCTQDLKGVMQGQPEWENLTASQKEMLDMVAHKIGRILTGDPDFQDHYDDISGYSTLISKQIQGEDL